MERFKFENKYQVIMLTIIGLFILVVSSAIFLSRVDFTPKQSGTVAIVLNEGDLVINYLDGDEVNFKDNKKHEYNISVTNNSKSKLFYSIYFSEFNNDDLEVIVRDSNNKVINSFNGGLKSNKLVNLYFIEGGKSDRFTIVVNSTKKGPFIGKLKVVNESLTTETFSDLILLHNNVTGPKTRVGNEVATTNEGLISTLDNRGNAYYFRGSIPNNYVKINNLLFRIVRINGDGTVRIVLDNVINGQYPYNTKELVNNEPINTKVLLSRSSVLDVLNKWFNDNLSNYVHYISEGDYCTDNIFNNNINGLNYSSTYERIYKDYAPDLLCGGVIHKGKIGLLSVDEVILAGAYGNVPNSDYYLYNSKIPGNYLTNSSLFINSDNNLAVINIMSNGAIGDGILINNSSYVRPVINLSVDAKVRGSGTIKDPYIIVA